MRGQTTPNTPTLEARGFRDKEPVDEISRESLRTTHGGQAVADAPFGGVKDSGFGSEGGKEGLETYQVVKAVHQA